MSDAPKISVEKAVAIIAKHCSETDCEHCPYSAGLPEWGFYVCMFRSVQPCDWKSSESADE